MGRMSPLHNPAGGLAPGSSVVPASRNGGSSNAAVNGASVDLRGKRGAYFMLHTGALTGAAAVSAHLEEGDNPADAANANWTDVNSTIYPNARIANQNTQSSAFEMDYACGAGKALHIRAVLTPEANVSLASISHVVY